MRILLLNDDFPPRAKGGSGVIAADLAAGYARQGHEVTVLTTHQDSRTKEERQDPADYRVISLPIRYTTALRPYLSLWNPAASRLIRAFLESEKTFDVAHAHNIHGYLTYQALHLIRPHVQKTVITFHDVMSFSYGRLTTKRYLQSGPDRFAYRIGIADHIRQAGITWNPVRNFLIRRALAAVDVKVAVSEALKNALEANGIEIDRVIHNGIDPSRCQPDPARIQALRSRLEIDNRPVIFFGGRLSRDKGLHQLLAAFDHIKSDFPTAIILVAGEEKRAKQLLADVPDQLQSHIRRAGWLDRQDLLAALSLSTVCVTPSVCFDSFPTINLEAMALAKPVIATHFGGSKELVEDGETGFIVNPFDAEEFAEKLNILLSNPTRAQEMGKAGRKRIEEGFLLKGQVRKYVSLWEKF